MLRNGVTVLKELIASSNGKYNSYQIFSIEELKLATNNYKNIKYDGNLFRVYDGFWQERLISVMKYSIDKGFCEYKDCINNIIYTAQMCHNHILKLIGCCLETQFPILVFEYFRYDALAYRIHEASQPQSEHLLLTHRLKIAMVIAHAVAYIHVGFPRPIIIRNFRSAHIVFNEENVAKLFDFSLSITIPEGETHVIDEARVRFPGYGAPEYEARGIVSEKVHVYSFGAFLFELLTGQRIWVPDRMADGVDNSLIDVKKCLEENRLDEIVDSRIVRDLSCPQKEQQLQTFRQLILECVEESPEDRPTMVDVAKKLRQMYRSCM